jgi:hypothetical protein
MSARHNQERGSIIIVAMLALVALISLGGLTTLSVQGGLASSGHDRFRSIALYAAESGAAVGMDYLRKRVHATTKWSELVNAYNDPPVALSDIPGSGVLPGQAGNPFSPDMKAWYEVTILNNIEDTGYMTGTDDDARVILRVTGHGPGGTVAQIEWEVRAGGAIGRATPCPSYAQQNMDAHGAGFNLCMSTIDNTVGTYSINTP